jgi:hypothetical protein
MVIGSPYLSKTLSVGPRSFGWTTSQAWPSGRDGNGPGSGRVGKNSPAVTTVKST